MRLWRRLGLTVFVAIAALAVAASVSAQPAPPVDPGAQMPAPPNLQPLRTRAETLFKTETFTSDTSELKRDCDGVLLGSQMIAGAIIIGGLWTKMRDENRQMDGIAIMLLKVGFIATIPTWQTNVVSGMDSLAAAIDYKSPAGPGSSPIVDNLWGLLQQWAPPSSPAVDALDAQMPKNVPGSGNEASWTLNAWHWAKGVGAADSSMFHVLWQTGSGSLRAFLVFGSCAAMACALSFVIAATYLAELLRYLLLGGGIALLPIFIAGVGVDALRSHSIRAILAIATVAAWPVGWAIANIVSNVIVKGTQTWMADVAGAAVVPLSLPATSFSIAAPYVAWSALFAFIAVTVAVCFWQLAALYYMPVLLARLFAASASTASSIVASHFEGWESGSTSRTSARSAAPRESRVVVVEGATTPRTAIGRVGPPRAMRR